MRDESCLLDPSISLHFDISNYQSTLRYDFFRSKGFDLQIIILSSHRRKSVKLTTESGDAV